MATFKYITRQEFSELDYAGRADYLKSAYDYYKKEYEQFKNEKDRRIAISYFRKWKFNEKKAEYEDNHKNFNRSSGRISKDELNALSEQVVKLAESNITTCNDVITWANENKYPLSESYKKAIYTLRSISAQFLDTMELFKDGLVSYVKL